MNKRIICAMLAALLTASFFQLKAFGEEPNTWDVEERLKVRTEQEIKSVWQKYKPIDPRNQYMSTTKIYSKKPSLKKPYYEGRLKSVYLKDGLNAVNFMRYLAGLPDDVTLLSSRAEAQQAICLVNSLNGSLSHSPKQPKGVPKSLYQAGLKGGRSSNLAYGSDTLYESVVQYMSDSDSGNIAAVGHRRWILNPGMKQTMFGFLRDGKGRAYSSLYSFDQSRASGAIDYDAIGWPSKGYFPSELLRGSDAWSLTLNPQKFKISDMEALKVTVRRETDSKEWILGSKNKDKNGDYLTVDRSGYGVPLCIIFKPAGINSYGEDAYSVTVSGLTDPNGTETELTYMTKFFRMLE